jgi:hypothetical protein
LDAHDPLLARQMRGDDVRAVPAELFALKQGSAANTGGAIFAKGESVASSSSSLAVSATGAAASAASQRALNAVRIASAPPSDPSETAIFDLKTRATNPIRMAMAAYQGVCAVLCCAVLCVCVCTITARDL